MPTKADLEFMVKIGTISDVKAKELEGLIKMIQKTEKAMEASKAATDKMNKEMVEFNHIQRAAKKRAAEAAKVNKRSSAAIEREMRKRLRTMEALDKAISKEQANYNRLEKAHKGMNRTFERGSALFNRFQKDIVRFGGAVDGTEKDIRDLNRTIERTGTKSIVRMKAAIDKAKGSFKKLKVASSGIFESMNRTIRRIITTMATLATLVLFRNLIKQGAEFEATMIRVAATAKATTEQFAALVGEVRKVARETIFTASQVGEVSQILAQAGFQTQEILNSLNPILQLAGATMGELGQTTELVVSILRAFNLETEKTIDVVNVLTEATLSSRANIERISVAFRFGGPAAAAFNQTVETTTAVLSRFIDLGLSASIAGTTLRRALIELSSGGARQVKVLKQLGLSLTSISPNFNDFGAILERLAKTTLDSTQAIQLFGARAGASVFALIQRIREGGETITEFAQKLALAKELNAVESLFSKISESIRAQSLLTKSALEEFGISLFNVFKPAIGDLLNNMRERFLALNETMQQSTGKNFSKTLQDLIPLFDALFDSLTAVVVILGRAIQLISFLVSKFETLGNIIRATVVVFGVMAVKGLFLNGVVVAIGKSLFSLGLVATKAASGIIGGLVPAVTAAGAATTALTFKVIALKAAIGLIGGAVIAGIVFLVSALLPKAISLFTKTDEVVTDNTKSMEEFAEKIGFGSEQMQRFTEQTKIQINSLKELNRLTESGKVIVAGFGEAAEALAVRLPGTFDLLPSLDAKEAEEPIRDLQQALDRLNEITTEGTTEIAGKVAEAVKFSKKDLQEINDSFEKAKSITQSFVTDVVTDLADLVERGISDKFKTAAQGEDFVKSFVEDMRKEAEKEGKTVADVIAPIAAAIQKEVDKRGVITFKFDRGSAKARQAFQDFVADLRIDPKIAQKNSAELEQMFIKFVQRTRDSATQIESLSEASQKVLEAQFTGPLEALGKQRVAMKNVSEAINRELRFGGTKAQDILLANQGKINKAMEFAGKQLEAAREKRKEIVAQMDKQAEGEKQASRAALELNDRQIQYAEGIIKTNQLLQRTIANLEEAKALEKVALANIAMERQQRRNVNILLEEKTKLMEKDSERFDALSTSASGFIGSLTDINAELANLKEQQKYDKVLQQFNEINRSLEMREVFERNVLNANKKLEIARLKNVKILRSGVNEAGKQLTDAQRATLEQEKKTAIAEANLEVEKAATTVSELNLKILKDREKREKMIQEIQMTRIGVAADLQRRQEAITESADAKPFNDILKASKTTEITLKNQIKLLDSLIAAAEKSGKLTEEQKKEYKEMRKGLQESHDLMSINNNLTEKEVRLRAKVRFEQKDQQRLQALNIIGMGELAQAIGKERAERQFLIKAEENILDLRKRESKLVQAVAQDEETLSKQMKRFKKEAIDMSLEEKQIAVKANDEIREKIRRNTLLLEIFMQLADEEQKSVDMIKEYNSAGVLGKTSMLLKSQVTAWAKNTDAAKELIATAKNIAGIIKSFVGAMIKEKVESFFGLHPEEEDKRAEQIAKIMDDLARKLAKIQEDFRQKLIDAEMDYRKRVADINADFDRERRDVERDIFNERVEKMMELAALEKQLRFQGLNDEQQRANLLAQIDSDLAAVRIGTIEERQMKLAGLQESIKALNELENRLGIAQSEIDQSSLARLEVLKRETSAFYNDKRDTAINSLEQERQKELAVEKARFADQIAKLQREKELAERRAREEAALQIKRIEDEKKTDNTMKQLFADLTMAVIGGIKDIVLAQVVATKIKSAITAKEITESNTQTQVEATNNLATLKGDAAVAGGRVVKGAAKAGPAAIPFMPILIGAVLAIFAGLIAMIVTRAKGGIIEEVKRNFGGGILKRAPGGGIFQGGKGGIDDIHTRLPVGSYVVNKQSTAAHRDELARMVRDTRNARQNVSSVPVAVTRGEFFIPPQTYAENSSRVEQINRDRTGTSSQSVFFGGPIKGLQLGGIASPSELTREPTKSVVIHNTVEFSGVNVLSGDSEEAVAMIYEQGLREKIQNDIDNKALV